MMCKFLKQVVWTLAASVILVSCGGSGSSQTPVTASVWIPSGVGTASILSFSNASSANGNIAPTRSLTGAATTLNGPTALTFDASGEMYVVDFNADAVDVYAPGANGNSTPIRRIVGGSTGIDGPEGVGVDAFGDIFVSNRNGNSVTVFDSAANGDAPPVRTITGAATTLGAPAQLVVMPAGDFYVANPGNDEVLYFDASANNNAAPTRALNVSLSSFPTGLALDSAENIYVSCITEIAVYPAGSSGAATPVRTISGAATDMQFVEGIALDSARNIYAGDNDANAIFVFGPTANGNVAPTHTIAGAATTLNEPLKPTIF